MRAVVSPRVLVLAVVIMLHQTVAVGAQTGVIGGTVLRDSGGHALSGAQVSLPALDRQTRTNFNGEFRIADVPAGKYAIVIRRLGFAPFTETISLVAGQSIDREFVLTEQATELDSQLVVAKSEEVEPQLKEFEDHRKRGYGYFIDKVELRKLTGVTPLINYIASRIPHLQVYRPDEQRRPLDYYLSSGRGVAKCPVTIFVDGVVWSLPRPNEELPDIRYLSSEDFSGVEYYAGGATIPQQYNLTANGCGTLVLWHRTR